MKFWKSEHIFGHCWETITQAAWRKYPNELNPNVKTIDVLDRHVDEGGCLQTKRIIGSEGILPSWVNRIIGLNDICYAHEHITVDPKEKTMTLRTKNISISSWVQVEEKLVYSQHPEDQTKTLLSQDAVIKVFGVSFKDYCESLIANSMASNAHKGRQAIEMVVDTINKEVQDLAHNLEHATTKLNTEFEQAKHGLEQAARLPTVMCEGAKS